MESLQARIGLLLPTTEYYRRWWQTKIIDIIAIRKYNRIVLPDKGAWTVKALSTPQFFSTAFSSICCNFLASVAESCRVFFADFQDCSVLVCNFERFSTFINKSAEFSPGCRSPPSFRFIRKPMNPNGGIYGKNQSSGAVSRFL